MTELNSSNQSHHPSPVSVLSIGQRGHADMLMTVDGHKGRSTASCALEIPAMLIDGERISQCMITAYRTGTGTWTAAMPLMDPRCSIAVQFGAIFEWLYIDAIAECSVDEFMASQKLRASELSITPSVDGMEQVSPNLFRCDDEASFMLMHRQASDHRGGLGEHASVLSIIFRPLAFRGSKWMPAMEPSANAA